MKLALQCIRKEEKHWNTLKVKLETSLLEHPPPTLAEVTKGLGYKVNAGLSTYYPELCSAIAIRHADYCRAQFEGIGHKLQEVLREEPPPSLRAVARRFGHAPGYLGEKFSGGVPSDLQALYGVLEEALVGKAKTSKDKDQAACLGFAREWRIPVAIPTQEGLGWAIGLSPTELCAFLREVGANWV